MKIPMLTSQVFLIFAILFSTLALLMMSFSFDHSLFSPRDRANKWLNSVLADSITTWEDLAPKFLAKFFPLDKIAKLHIEISNFVQYEGETLYNAWERYKDLEEVPPSWIA